MTHFEEQSPMVRLSTLGNERCKPITFVFARRSNCYDIGVSTGDSQLVPHKTGHSIQLVRTHVRLMLLECKAIPNSLCLVPTSS